jgi:hypothetical protein
LWVTAENIAEIEPHFADGFEHGLGLLPTELLGWDKVFGFVIAVQRTAKDAFLSIKSRAKESEVST